MSMTGPEALANAAIIRRKRCTICHHGDVIFDNSDVRHCKLKPGNKFYYHNFHDNCGFITPEDFAEREAERARRNAKQGDNNQEQEAQRVGEGGEVYVPVAGSLQGSNGHNSSMSSAGAKRNRKNGRKRK